jgi:lactoylglutathione lyase
MPITADAIAHVGIRAKDLDRSLGFYRDALGFPEMLRFRDNGNVVCVYMRASERQFIEIFPAGVGDQAPDFLDVGINHFCLVVPDVDEAAGQLSAEGISPAFELQTPLGRVLFIQDPDGNVVELKGRENAAFEQRAADAAAAGEEPTVVG